MSQRLLIAKQIKLPDDEKTIADYSDPKFVLGNDWRPLLAPIVTTQPRSASVRVGEKVVLSVEVAAVPAPGYQWQKNEKNINGANQSTYSITTANRRNAGVYSVVVSSIAGKVVSDPARISVITSGRD